MPIDTLWIELGYKHLLDINGYDHILYIATLCAVYHLRQWRTVIWLVTAFTLGHTLSIALNVYDLVSVDGSLVELLIPITIILTALYNLVMISLGTKEASSRWVGYLLAMGFGIIHGLGISNYLKALMTPSDSLGWTLLGFNIGVELAQIVVVIFSLALSYLVIDICRMPRRYWVWMVSILSIIICLQIILS